MELVTIHLYAPEALALDEISIGAKITRGEEAWTFYIKRSKAGYRVWGAWGKEEISISLPLAIHDAHQRAGMRLQGIVVENFMRGLYGQAGGF